jgi:hypothetical protein
MVILSYQQMFEKSDVVVVATPKSYGAFKKVLLAG